MEEQEVEKRRIKRRICYQELISCMILKIVYIRTAMELKEHFPRMLQLVEEYMSMGLDAEWTMQDKERGPVALLQIGFADGTCYILAINEILAEGRQCSSGGGTNISVLPKAFLHLLADERYLKFGVGVREDAKYLLTDHGLTVRGFVDIRHLFDLLRVEKTHRLGLKDFSEHWLGYKYSPEELLAQQSDWGSKALNLSSVQMRYAALDALVGALCPLEFLCRRREEIWIKKAGNELVDDEELRELAPNSSENLKDLRENLRSYCQGCVGQAVPNQDVPNSSTKQTQKLSSKDPEEKWLNLVISAASALLKPNIPAARRGELEERVRLYLTVEEMSKRRNAPEPDVLDEQQVEEVIKAAKSLVLKRRDLDADSRGKLRLQVRPHLSKVELTENELQTVKESCQNRLTSASSKGKSAQKLMRTKRMFSENFIKTDEIKKYKYT